MKKKHILTFIFCCTCLFSIAQIIHVPGDQPTIQAGIDAAGDGDTVLVDPWTYKECFDFKGKNITVASLYLITQDTSYISQTIIDGEDPYWNSVVTFSAGEDSSAFLSGFTITNGSADNGGGIFIANSRPTLSGLIIKNNRAEWLGGGICIINSNPALYDVIITDNIVENGSGGGVYCEDASPLFADVTITDNKAYFLMWPSNQEGVGGGFSLLRSNPILNHVIIKNNEASNGYGGGISANASNPVLTDVQIVDNYALYGGGIAFHSSTPVFDTINRCSIYENHALYGNELYSDTMIHIVADTFSVLFPTEFYADPVSHFTFDILHGKIQQVDADLYISPEGSDDNSGLTETDPLKTIHHAFSIIRTDSVHPHSISLMDGTYSPSTNDEHMPLNIPDYLALVGVSEDNVILDAEGQSRVLIIDHNVKTVISKMTIKDGRVQGIVQGGEGGGGILCNHSDAMIMNVTLDSNAAYYADEMGGGFGGGICCEHSSPVLQNMTISNNYGSSGGGIACIDESHPVLQNAVVTDNNAEYYGGGIYCYFDSNPTLLNVTVADNNANWGGGGVSCESNSQPSFWNTILWNNFPQEIYFIEMNSPNSITLSYSDVKGGEDSIVSNNNGTVNWLEGNINEDPLFVGNDDHPYRLSAGSPCIDTGTPDTTNLNLPPWDILGNWRIWDGDGDGISIIDMGAYEFAALPVSTSTIDNRQSTISMQVFPNPSFGISDIKYQISDIRFVALDLYDMKGQKIRTLVDKSQSPGEYNVSFDTSGLTAGIYLIRLQAGEDALETAKLVVMR